MQSWKICILSDYKYMFNNLPHGKVACFVTRDYIGLLQINMVASMILRKNATKLCFYGGINVTFETFFRPRHI